MRAYACAWACVCMHALHTHVRTHAHTYTHVRTHNTHTLTLTDIGHPCQPAPTITFSPSHNHILPPSECCFYMIHPNNKGTATAQRMLSFYSQSDPLSPPTTFTQPTHSQHIQLAHYPHFFTTPAPLERATQLTCSPHFLPTPQHAEPGPRRLLAELV